VQIHGIAFFSKQAHCMRQKPSSGGDGEYEDETSERIAIGGNRDSTDGLTKSDRNSSEGNTLQHLHMQEWETSRPIFGLAWKHAAYPKASDTMLKQGMHG
jgi:hypothetical protein